MPGVSRRGVAAPSSARRRPILLGVQSGPPPVTQGPRFPCPPLQDARVWRAQAAPPPAAAAWVCPRPPAKAGPEPGTESPRGVGGGATERAVPRSQGGSKLPLWVRGEMTAESRVSEGEELATCAPGDNREGAL